MKKQEKEEIREYVKSLYTEKDECEFDDREKFVGRLWDILKRLQDEEEEFWYHNSWKGNRDAQKFFWTVKDRVYWMIKKMRDLEIADEE